MKFEYDPNKSGTNKDKHGIDFEEAQALWEDDNALVIEVCRPGEPRSIIVARLNGQLWSGVFTCRNKAVRIISVRRSRQSEVNLYGSD